MNFSILKRYFVFILLFCIQASGCGKVYSTKFYAPRELRVGVSKVAVLPFTDLTGREENSKVIEKFFVEEITRNYGVEVIEGDELKRRLSEKRFDLEDLSNRSEAYRIAQILNVDAVVLGSVLEYRYRRWMTRERGVSEDPVVCLGARVINGKTGTVAWAATNARTDYGIFTAGRNPLAGLAQKVVRDLVRSIRFNKK